MKKQLTDNVLLFLKSAMWQDRRFADAASDVNWKEMYAIASEQCVASVIADAFKYVSAGEWGGEVKMKWLAHVVMLERRNQDVDKQIGRLFEKLHGDGLSPVLLKGQAFAANYPYPLHRQCGDIDIYFKHREDCDKAVAWASQIDKAAAASPDNKRERKHFTFCLGRNVVELHYFMCLFDNERLQQRLQAIIDKEFAENPPYHVVIGNKQIETVPPTLSVLHQLIHISRHLLEAGVGLRQVCDLALFLDKRSAEVDTVRLNGYLKDLQLVVIAKALGYVMTHHLGLDEHKLPFGKDGRYADFILKEIFDGGNFGKKNTEYRNYKCGLLRKIQSMVYFYKRCKLYKPLFPSEAKSYFLNKIKLNIKLLTKHHY